ncbi:MAG TPA: ROK family protein [Usitatibacter sp.]|nr:ROK family protein [Usitatibacter sp.]
MKKKKNGKTDSKRACIGIDIGGTKSLYALFDSNFEVLAEEKLRTHPEKGGVRAFTRALKGTVDKLMREARKRGLKVKCVGVGCAGDIDLKRGVIRHSPNLEFLDGYRLHDKLERLTKANVFVGHDVQAALNGEFRRGAARKSRHVIGVWLGTGVGGALIIDGRLHLGVSGQAGDLGNYLLHAVDVSQELPRKEVLDNVASRTAIAGDAAALAAKHHAPSLQKAAGTDVRDIKASALAEAIRAGDKHVEKLVRSRASVVGAALSNLVDFLNPDMIVLGGGLVEAMPALMRREIRQAIEAHAAPKAAKAVDVRIAKLLDHAGTVGAACLAMDMFSGDPPIDLDAL